MKLFYPFVAFIALLFLFACGSTPKNNQATETVAVNDTLAKTTLPVNSDTLPKETEPAIIKDENPKGVYLPIVKEKLPKGLKPCTTDTALVSETKLEAVTTLGSAHISKGKGFDNYLYRGSGKGVAYEKMMSDRGFKVYVDTTQTIALKNEGELCKAYPVFLVNETKGDLYLNLEDGQVMMIQEAKDENGNWHPIEEWAYSTCGNSMGFALSFRPQKLGMTRIRQYTGSFETELRVKVGTGEGGGFIYSHTFRGRINKSQLADATAFAKKYPKLLFDPRQP